MYCNYFNMRMGILLSLLLFLIPALGLESNRQYSLKELIASLKENNLDLKSQSKVVDELDSRIFQQGYLPNPVLSYTYFGEEIQTKSGPQKQKFGLVQKLPWLSKLESEKAVAEQSKKLAQVNRDKILNQLILRLKLLWAELHYLNDQKLNLQITQRLFENWLDKLKVDYEVSKGSLNKILKMEIEIELLRDKVKSISNEVKNRMLNVKQLLNFPDSTSMTFNLKEELNIHSKEEMGHKLDHNPLLTFYKEEQTLWEKKKTLKRKNYFPDLSLGVNYFQTGSIAGSPDPWNVVLGVSVPFNFKKTQAELSELQVRKKKSIVDQQNVMNQLEEFRRTSLNDFNNAKREEKLYREIIIPKIRQTIDVQESELIAGKDVFMQLLDAYKMDLEYQLKIKNSIKEQFQAQAKILWTIGGNHEG